MGFFTYRGRVLTYNYVHPLLYGPGFSEIGKRVMCREFERHLLRIGGLIEEYNYLSGALSLYVPCPSHWQIAAYQPRAIDSGRDLKG